MSVTTAQTNLERANAIRRRRKDEHQELHDLPKAIARDALADLLEDPPEWLKTAAVGEVLCWPIRTTSKELNAWLDAAAANPRARVSGAFARDNSNQNPGVLSERQRLILAACLRGDHRGELTHGHHHG